jgi:ubiquitin-protein ligase
MPVKTHIKRIISKDMKSIKEHELEKNGIFITFNEEDITEAYAMIIGPKDSCYEGGLLYFTINFPTQYPHIPPKVQYISRGSIRIHPNLYRGRRQEDYLGKVCLSLLGTWAGPGWTSIMDITSILLTIQSLLTNDPLTKEPGYTNSTGGINERYNTCVEFETLRTLIVKNSLEIPYGLEEFKPHIINHFKENFDSIFERYKNISKEKNNITVMVSVYSINLHIDYSQLLEIYNCEIRKLIQ